MKIKNTTTPTTNHYLTTGDIKFLIKNSELIIATYSEKQHKFTNIEKLIYIGKQNILKEE